MIMRTSDQINEIALALSKAQGEMQAAEKDGTNPHFRSNYATLDSIWKACRRPLASNGLSVVQFPGSDDAGHYLETMLMHASGQFISNQMRVVPDKNNIQGLGSVLTYTRRYALASIVGITSDEDDDGNGSVEQGQKVQSKKKAKPAKKNGQPSQQAQAVKTFFEKVQDKCKLNEKTARLICNALKIKLDDPSKFAGILETLCQETEKPSTMPSLIVAANRKTDYYYARDKTDLMKNWFHVKGSVEKLHPDIAWPTKPGNPNEWKEALVLAIEYAQGDKATEPSESDGKLFDDSGLEADEPKNHYEEVA